MFNCYYFVCDEIVFHLVYVFNNLWYELIVIQDCFIEADHDQFSDQMCWNVMFLWWFWSCWEIFLQSCHINKCCCELLLFFINCHHHFNCFNEFDNVFIVNHDATCVKWFCHNYFELISSSAIKFCILQKSRSSNFCNNWAIINFEDFIKMIINLLCVTAVLSVTAVDVLSVWIFFIATAWH